MAGGRYTFEREIGRGASGPVWSGHDTVLGRRVALKRVGVHPGASSADATHADREARLAASLSHPHVVGVLDLTVIEGEHWLVMECVEGTNLARMVREQGPLEPRRAARLLAQVTEALTLAHRAGIVHRDVKPSNVLVTLDDVAKLTDFGIARGVDDPSVTRTGLVTGSPAYLAPEVATGSAATRASDVWSLGATLYHLVDGRPPYDVGDNVLSTMYRIVHEDPPRLPDAGPLDVVLRHTMATDPAQRWTMQEVHEALLLACGEQPAQDPARVLPSSRSADVLDTPSGSTRVVAAFAPDGGDTSLGGSVERTWVRRSAWLAGAAVVVTATVLAFVLGRGDRPADDVTAAGPDPVPTTSAPQDPSPQGEVTEATLSDFVEDYLGTVTQDLATSWNRLTPQFQQASNGFDSYQKFWRSVRSASPTVVDVDLDAMTVTYEVDYVMRNGNRTSDTVTLRLAHDGSQLLIAGES